MSPQLGSNVVAAAAKLDECEELSREISLQRHMGVGVVNMADEEDETGEREAHGEQSREQQLQLPRTLPAS